ncbi:PAS domain-containing sensor histidine kinase (plasmid) [Halorubrum sp. BOL3-1]|uniref:PAS domain-containing sensor histidine kinase n=1 Tax=Halorubrum sp. BOL3-1 TaxID=2497325 RepID=UPI00100502D9|nr:PAS domain-containing sensor histidine kinase [Halorubrum sp. BOL3-1]QAU11365.1 PAS domain-containing sensor histidine kinase [Halorubrum sp. BOL3-1]
MLPSEGSTLPPVLNRLHTGIAVYDSASGAILDANERVSEILGYPRTRLQELSVAEYTANTYPHAENVFYDRLAAAANGDPQQFMWRVKREDGELVWIQMFASQERSAADRRVYVEMRDITRHYETRHKAELFWRILRHNLRNEAAIITGCVEQAMDRSEDEACEEILSTILARGEKLGGIATSVKQIEQAAIDSQPDVVRCSAKSAIRDVVDQIAIEYPDVDIRVNERSRMSVAVNSAFDHAVTHAIKNAIVHNDEENPVVDVDIGPSPNTGRVEICIKDTNPQIPPEEVAALSSPTATTSTSHGSGTGLFVIKWCIESLGGEVMFEPREPVGNTVSLLLPPK